MTHSGGRSPAHPTTPASVVAAVLTLDRRGAPSIGQTLLLRAGLALALMGVALAGHWLDRDGLRDNSDGKVSFVDVLYFTPVTITTVGYGDIVPVTRRRGFSTRSW